MNARALLCMCNMHLPTCSSSRNRTLSHTFGRAAGARATGSAGLSAAAINASWWKGFCAAGWGRVPGTDGRPIRNSQFPFYFWVMTAWGIRAGLSYCQLMTDHLRISGKWLCCRSCNDWVLRIAWCNVPGISKNTIVYTVLEHDTRRDRLRADLQTGKQCVILQIALRYTFLNNHKTNLKRR